MFHSGALKKNYYYCLFWNWNINRSANLTGFPRHSEPCPRQESTSEAINAWYAMQLYGEAIGDDSMRRTGQLLAAHEMEAARVYWRSTAAHSVYPAEFAKHKGVRRRGGGPAAVARLLTPGFRSRQVGGREFSIGNDALPAHDGGPGRWCMILFSPS